MNDAVGTELNIRDIVFFTYDGDELDCLYQGIIISFRRGYIRIHNAKTNMDVERLPKNVISIMPIKKVHPENFI